MKKIILLFITIVFLSCEKEETKKVTCTTYFNGAIYSIQTVDKCENCFAPKGYTTKCQ